MNNQFLKPRQAFNKIFLKVKIVRTQIGVFKRYLIRLKSISVFGLAEEEVKILEGGEW